MSFLVYFQQIFLNSLGYQNIILSSPLTSNQIYTLSAYAKRLGSSQPKLSLQAFDSNDNLLLYEIFTKNIQENEWEKISHTFTVPAGTVKIRAIIRTSVKDNDIIRFDAVQLENKDFDSPFTTSTLASAKNLYDLNVSKDAGTMTTWFKTKTVPSYSRHIVSIEGTNKELFNVVIGTDNIVSVGYRKNGDDNVYKLITTTETVPLNEWQFMSLKWEYDQANLNVTFYLNGNKYTASTSDFRDFSNGKIALGSSYFGKYQLNGLMEQFTYSAKAIPDPIIENIYNQNRNDIMARVTNDYSYENDRMKTVSHNIDATSSVTYSFNYDDFGNTTGIYVGDQLLTTNNYEQTVDKNGQTISTGKLLSTQYSNNDTISYEYDNLDRMTELLVNGDLQFKYHFNASGNLGYHEDIVNGVDYRYEYDLAERLVSVVANNGYAISYNYDVNNNISKVTEEINNKQFETDYLYDNDNRLKDVTYTRDGVLNKVSNNYDTIGRLDTRTVTHNTTPINTTSYTFEAGGQGTNSTTSLVKTMTTNGHTYTFTYDDVGNITEITDNDGSTTKAINYDYNELNELVREDNKVINKTIVYDYDLGGNILSKTEYPYTLGDLTGVTGTKIDYTYGNANWKDQLTKYDGKTIDYDAIGNPISYDGYTYSWEAGDQLAGISSTEVTTSYKYNDGGFRTEKTVNGVTTNYYLEGSHVTYETTGTDEIYYTYDSKLISMNLNGEEYFYVYNLQGDVVGLLDSTGTEVVSYTYDTWGKVLSITGTDKDTVGVKNPYRYRGYRYDSETGLYYLNARYYNPEWGRMLNADSFGGFTGELLSHNVYAYVQNNPVMLYDPTGHFGQFILPAILVTALAVDFAISMYNAYEEEGMKGVAKEAGKEALYTAATGGGGKFLAKYGAKALGPLISNATVKSVSNMNEFFDMEFGQSIKNSLSKSNIKYDGQVIYKVTQKTSSEYLKKGYGIYLDGMHKDHLEVINKTGHVIHVLNLDGTLNTDKTKKAFGRNVREWRK
ncbi:hypothetical protein CIB95_02210 [Lottiidibacillus patelloidae]|uniref:Teneurin-like YD-shell domain-containing protein n=1 Tax=Lottiidibacillus patelloidae TaxID=2670334 RepID=A0A263BXF4_9BACI|nr:RHS repeat-associated core domain-containing protein [Lottiidibacillus patelloidae]OZM58405.1 hypothetical protein CIB95_02210 [Lottiidibacillus patelloidae]